MYYDVNKTLTHNALINMIIGPRGYGKTYGLKCRAIKNFLKDGSQFIYLRRFDSELKLVRQTLFDDVIVNGEIPDGSDFKYNKGGYYTLGDEVVGYAMSLSRSNYYKSSSFPFVTLIIYDEFIIDVTQSLRYLNNEVRKLLDFVETIARMRENVRVFLLANSLSFVNPYTIYWNLKLQKGKKVCKTKNGLVLCELVGDDEFKEAKKKTGFGRLNEGTEFERMAVENEFILDSEKFIAKKTTNAKHLFSYTFEGVTYGVWIDYEDGLYYVSNDYDPSCKINYSLTTKDHTPNYTLVRGKHKSLFGKTFEKYSAGLLRFENNVVESSFINAIKKLTT